MKLSEIMISGKIYQAKRMLYNDDNEEEYFVDCEAVRLADGIYIRSSWSERNFELAYTPFVDSREFFIPELVPAQTLNDVKKAALMFGKCLPTVSQAGMNLKQAMIQLGKTKID